MQIFNEDFMDLCVAGFFCWASLYKRQQKSIEWEGNLHFLFLFSRMSVRCLIGVAAGGFQCLGAEL